MRHIKTLFLLFIFVFPFFLQGRASAKNLSDADRLTSYDSPQTSGLSSTVVVYMYRLKENGSEWGPNSICTLGDPNYGCSIQMDDGTLIPYPPPATEYIRPYYDDGRVNPLKVDVDHYYLQNVLPREMDVVGNAPTLNALKAQALAARSIADWKADSWGQDPFKAIANYTIDYYQTRGFQVFVPGSYDNYYNHHVPGEKERIQALVDQAIRETSGEYLFYANNQGFLSLDAEFSNDIGRIVDGNLMTEDGNQDYLIPIQDPISNGCDLYPVGNGWGMSQKGAIRWSKGNQCAGSGDQPCPVKWDSENGYKQILTHYYTGIDILDRNGNPIAPNDRWNLIEHNIELDANRMGSAEAGQPYQFIITLQNTSTSSWNDSNTEIYYQWTAKGADATEPWLKFEGFSVSATDKGSQWTSPDLPITTPSSGGDYTLHLDLYRNGHWFSQQNLPWPDATIDIHVNGPTATPTSLATNTSTPIVTTPVPPTSVLTNTPSPTSTPVTALRLVGTEGTCTAGPYITCSSVITPIQTNPYRWDFDISYTYNDDETDMGSDFKVYLTLGTGVFQQGVPIWWEVVPIQNEGMPARWIHVPFFSGSQDLNPMPYPSGSWMIPAQPQPYDTFTINFSKVTGASEILQRTDSWHVTVATYDFLNGPPPTATPPPLPVCSSCPLIRIIQQLFTGCTSPTPSADGFSAAQSGTENIDEQIPPFDIDVFYRVRNELLSQTLQGEHYIDLYETYSPEIAETIVLHPQLMDEAIVVLQRWEPHLRALLDGQGETVVITQEDVDAAELFLSNLGTVASNDLKTTLQTEAASLNMQGLVGQTMSQAWEEIGGIATSTPTNTSTNGPTFTSTPSPTETPTATQTSGTVSFAPLADSYVSESSPTTNYGSNTTLRADASPVVRSYLRFNVQGLSSPVTRATLRVYANSASSLGYQVQEVSDNIWVESTINYNNMPSLGASLGSSGSFGAGIWTTVDVTNYITGNGVFNLALTTTSSTAISFASRESGANAPKLVIETQGGSGPTITPTFTPTITVTLTSTSTSQFTPTSTPTATTTPSQTLTPTPPTLNSAFYLSLSGQATLGGVTGEDTDILYYDGTNWSLFFDASDVGVTDSGNDLNDFYLLDADTILMSFRDPITLGSLAVDPYDVVQFDATSLGSTTAGSFSLYFDGNDVGLDDPVAEMLNGFDLLPDGRLLFSTDGSFTVPGLTGRDEDIFAFTPTTLGEMTSGTWAMYFDGSLAGIGLGDTGEDVDLLDVAANGDIYLSAEGTFAVPGISGEDEDIFVCTPTFAGGAVSSCIYSPTLFFDGSTWGLADNDVDAMYLP